MLIKDRLDRLGAVAAHLPFPLEDYDAANRVFARWAEQGRDADLEVVEVWLYCYVQRYVLVRLVRMPHIGGSDADRMIDDMFSRAHSQLDRVANPSCFTHWVSVVCRNTFVNGLRRCATRAELASMVAPEDPADEPEFAEPDRALVRHTLARAIEALPASLRPVAQMRLLEGRSYRHIAAVTGHTLPTVRAYTSKAMSRLREDPGLRVLRQALDLASP